MDTQETTNEKEPCLSFKAWFAIFCSANKIWMVLHIFFILMMVAISHDVLANTDIAINLAFVYFGPAYLTLGLFSKMAASYLTNIGKSDFAELTLSIPTKVAIIAIILSFYAK